MSTDFEKPSCSKYYTESNDSVLVRQLLGLLQPLDDLLKCHICFEYFKTCMITKCCHSYCSLCIRKYMTYKTQCPECFKEATEVELRSNRQIDQVIQIYDQIKRLLETTVGNLGFTHQLKNMFVTAEDEEISNAPAFIDPLPSNSSTAGSVNLSIKDLNTEDSSKVLLEMENNSEIVSCPVCCAKVLPSKINSHLDICLVSGGNSEQSIDNEERGRNPLPKVVYHLLNEKEIKKLLKRHGLSTAGNRQSLVRRHKSFLVLYNAECDSLNPRPVSEIVRQVEREESALFNSPPKLFQTDKKSDQALIREENEKYLKENKDQFDALVSDVINRQDRKNSSVAVDETDDNACVTSDAFEELCDSPFTNNSADLFDDSPVSSEDIVPRGVTIICDPARASTERDGQTLKRLAVDTQGNQSSGQSSSDLESAKSCRRSERVKRKLADGLSSTSTNK